MAGVSEFKLVAAGPALFGSTYVKSAAFKTMFKDGMTLIEDTANYLDGDGRAASASLDRNAALTYAGESMRLTTRLMQVASWLLVQRAVAEGELTRDQALKEKQRVRLAPQTVTASERDFAALPERLRELIDASLRLHARVSHLDALVIDVPDEPVVHASPALRQQDMLRSAFLAS